MVRRRRPKAPTAGAFGNKMQRIITERNASKILTVEEQRWLTTLCFYDVPQAARIKIKRKILEMKNRDLKPILERLNKYLENRLLEPEKRTKTELIRTKLQRVIDERNQ